MSVVRIAQQGSFQWGAQVVATIFGCILIGILIPISIWLIKKGLDARKAKTPEEKVKDDQMLTKLTETYILVKDTRDDVKDIKSDITDIKKTQFDHEKRLTGLEKEHTMYSKAFHCQSQKDKTKEMVYVRVLIVDDQPEAIDYMIDYFHKILPEKNGWNKYIFQVDGVKTYDEGVRKIDGGEYDLGLYDVSLSKTDPRDGFLLARYSLKNGLKKFFVYSADNDLKNIPKEFSERFLVKPSSNEAWAVFENRLKEMV